MELQAAVAFMASCYSIYYNMLFLCATDCMAVGKSWCHRFFVCLYSTLCIRHGNHGIVCMYISINYNIIDVHNVMGHTMVAVYGKDWFLEL